MRWQASFKQQTENPTKKKDERKKLKKKIKIGERLC